MVLDSHVHFWKYKADAYPWIDKNMQVLKKDYLPQDIELTLKRNNIEGCIAVQATSTELETRFLAELSNTHPVIKGVVGWTNLQANDLEKRLSDLKAYPAIKGIRHIVQEEPDDFMYNGKFRSGISMLADFGFTYDILIYPRQLAAATDLVKAFPQQQFILDHCAKPDIAKRELEIWKSGITDLAMYPNVSCKLSGLLTEARWKDWSPADFYPYLDVVFGSFGVERVMFGSDWPVLLLSGLYVQWKSLLEKYMEQFLPEDKEKVFGLTAQRVYRV